MYGYLVMVCVVMVTRTDEGKGRSSEQYVWLLTPGVCCHGDQDWMKERIGRGQSVVIIFVEILCYANFQFINKDVNIKWTSNIYDIF